MGIALVLGASGFLGSHLTRQLVAEGRSVRTFTRATSDLTTMCGITQTLMHALGKDTRVTIRSLKLSRRMGTFDNSKARKELGWEPRPFVESVREAVRWFQNNATRT